MMRNKGLLFKGWFRGSDVELAIHGDGIAIHDFSVKPDRKLNRKGGLTAARWTQNYKQSWIGRQSAQAPVQVVPVASDRDGMNENRYDHDTHGLMAREMMWDHSPVEWER